MQDIDQWKVIFCTLHLNLIVIPNQGLLGQIKSSLTGVHVCACQSTVVYVLPLHVCFIIQCQRKSVVCPGTWTGTVEVLVGSYDSALQH